MTGLVVVCAVLGAGAAWLMIPPGSDGSTGRLVLVTDARPPDPTRRSAASRPAEPGHGRILAVLSMLAAIAPMVLLGGAVGLLAGPLVGAAVWRTLRAREPVTVRRRRAHVARVLPQVVDLLAVTLASGASPGTALATVASAVGPPVDHDLRAVERGLTLGRDPVRVWHDAAALPGLEPLGRAMVRAVDSGVSVADALHRLAEDLHAAERLSGETRARSVGVRVAAPLGLCLLPAFVLVGVVPLVASTLEALLGG